VRTGETRGDTGSEHETDLRAARRSLLTCLAQAIRNDGVIAHMREEFMRCRAVDSADTEAGDASAMVHYQHSRSRVCSR
jgi:hypothetical protein